jgi:hypothetical protein
MCYGVMQLRSMKDSTIEIRFYLAIERLFDCTDVCPLCGPHDVCTAKQNEDPDGHPTTGQGHAEISYGTRNMDGESI